MEFGWIPEPGHVGPPRSNQNDSPGWVVLQFLQHLPKMATNRKAYGTRGSHGRLSALIAQAWGSGTGDTNLASLLLNLIARGLFEVDATYCTLPGRTLEGETTLFELPGLASIVCLLPHSAGLECVGL